MRQTRYQNIVNRRPSTTTRTLLLSKQSNIEHPDGHVYQPQPWNIIFASKLVPSTSFIVVAEYAVRPVEFYFMQVMKFTTVQE